MSRSFACKLSVIGVGLCLVTGTSNGTISQYSRNDPFPVNTSQDPHTFLYTFQKQTLKGLQPIRDKQERLSLSISPFGQNATDGKDIDGNPGIPLGDLNGRWNMIGLLYGPTPQNQTLSPILASARACLFPSVPAGTPINDPFAIDRNQQFGFFSVPLLYWKRGLRFELEALLCHDIGFKLDAGVADILQVTDGCVTPISTVGTCTTNPAGLFINDLTCAAVLPPCGTSPVSTGSFDPNNPNLTVNNVESALMLQICNIAPQICLDLCNFHQFSAEDVRASLYWRHAFLINKDRDPEDWALFLFTPFVSIDASVAAGKKRPIKNPFALSFGSNDYNAVGANAGLDLDFAQTVELGAEAGFCHFFGRDICNMQVPTSCYQSGIYPFCTDVHVKPGLNWFFGAKLAAYQFLGNLSFFFQYILVEHKHDKIELKEPDPAFIPEILECKSSFKIHLANVAFNYDLSPNVSLGLLWQAPLMQFNAYRSTTVLITVNITY